VCSKGATAYEVSIQRRFTVMFSNHKLTLKMQKQFRLDGLGFSIIPAQEAESEAMMVR